MSQALAQSTSKLAESPVQLEEFPFGEVLVKLASQQSAKQAVKSKLKLNRQSLCDTLKNEYVSRYPQIYPDKHVELSVWKQIVEQVNLFLAKQFGKIHAGNVTSSTATYVYDKKSETNPVKLRHTLIGEDELTLQQQHCNIVFIIADAEKALLKVQVTNPPDLSKITKAEAKLQDLQLAKVNLEKEIQRQQTLLKAT